MISILRNLFLPAAAFLLIAGLAWGEWSRMLETKRAAKVFHGNSRVCFFSYVGDRDRKGVAFPIYQFEQEGQSMEFRTPKKINLPDDGRVRMGPDPLSDDSTAFNQISEREIVIPMNGPDSVETVYKGMRGHDIGEDITKASLVSVAALVAGLAGFFLQRIIFRDVGKALGIGQRSRRGHSQRH